MPANYKYQFSGDVVRSHLSKATEEFQNELAVSTLLVSFWRNEVTKNLREGQGEEKD